MSKYLPSWGVIASILMFALLGATFLVICGFPTTVALYADATGLNWNATLRFLGYDVLIRLPLSDAYLLQFIINYFIAVPILLCLYVLLKFAIIKIRKR